MSLAKEFLEEAKLVIRMSEADKEVHIVEEDDPTGFGDEKHPDYWYYLVFNDRNLRDEMSTKLHGSKYSEYIHNVQTDHEVDSSPGFSYSIKYTIPYNVAGSFDDSQILSMLKSEGYKVR